MKRSYRLIETTRRGDALVVALRFPRMDEEQITLLAEELLDAAADSGCSKYILRFGPTPVECLYSVFLAKLITLQRKLAEQNIGLVLSELHPAVTSVFQACKLIDYFLIADTLETAVNLTLPNPLPGHTPPPCTRTRCGGPHPGEEPHQPQPT